MKQHANHPIVLAMTLIGSFFGMLHGQGSDNDRTLTEKQCSLIPIAAQAAIGDLEQLKPALHEGLDAGWTVREIQEGLVHVYAYAGFPRSIRSLQTFMEVLEDRKGKGKDDPMGRDASPVTYESGKYESGKQNLEELVGRSLDGPQTGYAAFAPVIEIFLKEHLFADLFDRDVLTFAERELVTISVLASLGGVEPMLRSHLTICRNLGYSPEQLKEFVSVIQTTSGKKKARAAGKVLEEVLNAGSTE